MIELRDIQKNFGTVKALRGVSLKVTAGSIHGIVGENGAGKSTLMKVLTGFITRTSGTIIYAGKEVDLRTPMDARALGIGMLYQEPLDFLQLSVLDNFMAGAPRFDRSVTRTALLKLTARFGFELNPDSSMQRLTVGERQQLELLRLIHEGTQVLILDEPTTGISESQQELLFAALRSLKEEGCAIILVSHKLSEVESLCDRVSVLRHGKIAGHQEQPFDNDELLQAMFDTLPKHESPPEPQAGGQEILAFTDTCSSIGRSGLDHVSISIREGEIIGLAGLDGSGQSVFLKIAAGLLAPDSGSILRFGRNPADSDLKQDRQETVFLPADRLSEGLIAGLSIREHLLLSSDTPLFIVPKTGLADAEQAISKFNILGRPETVADGLSGGNQQRLLLSLMPPAARLILMENPTRGLDVQSGAWTWQHLRRQMPGDGAIIFASPDLEEIMEHAGRVLVFFDGRIILDKAVSDTSFNQVSRAITGQVGVRA
jgi:simple sugar transport system ATP-binding protein